MNRSSTHSTRWQIARVDTLNCLKYTNLKALPFDGVLQATFAFALKRDAVILLAADKSGGSKSL